MSNLGDRAIYQRVYPVDDPAMYKQWAVDHPYCMACGVSAREAPFAPNCGGIGLSTHHIIKPGRSDEKCNLLRLCKRDHDLAEGMRIRVRGELLPVLTIGVCLTLKKVRDPGDWNPERLTELFRQTLPEMEAIPDVIQADWKRRHPWEPSEGGIRAPKRITAPPGAVAGFIRAVFAARGYVLPGGD